METILTTEMMASIMKGDTTSFLAYSAIFVFIWVEVRGIKKQLTELNKNIAQKFTEGEHRFEAIESRLGKIEHLINP